MKYFSSTLLILLFSLAIPAQDIPFNLVPGWESTPEGHVATGLALADINGDGWKDIVAANGNDIYRQHLVVYYNNGDGTFPYTPSWSSADIDFHGHCAAGDINQDGRTDIAVSVYIGPDGFSEPGKVKVYYNTGGELEANPSFESVEFYTFSCSLGDADADGDLDLAVAASESYGGIWDYGKVFLNNDGLFNENPDWESSNLMGAMDVEFGDMDSNGFLDLVFICNEHHNAIFLADNSGTIDTDPDWQSAETTSTTYNNSLDIGYFGETGFPGFVTTGNDQLGGDGKIRFYKFESGVPANSPAAWTSPGVGYGSGIILADVTRDGNLDLIYGGWWHPMEIIPGTGDSFQDETAYTSSTSSVVEAIQLADLGREAVVPMLDTISGVPDQSHAVRINAQMAEEIVSVSKNGVLLNPTDYCYVPNKSWISFAEPLSAWDVIVVESEQSADPDIVITNWDSSIGNFIFYNTNISIGITGNKNPNGTRIYPNPARDVVNIISENPISGLFLSDFSGRHIKCSIDLLSPKKARINLSELPGGMYHLKIVSGVQIRVQKLIISR